MPNIKHVVLAVTAMLAVLLPGIRAADKKVDVSKIHGRIQYVNSFPDYKVQAVTSFPDLRVEIVNSLPNSAGQWQIVNSFPDYKIQMVDSFPDFTVQFVTQLSRSGEVDRSGNVQLRKLSRAGCPTFN